MRNAVLGGLMGVLLGALVLAACGGSGSSTSQALTQEELDPQIATLQAQIDTLQSQVTTLENATPVPTTAPLLGMHYCIALVGTFPSRSLTTGVIGEDPSTELSNDPMLGAIGLFAGNFPPRGWAFCDGQTLQISEHSALFSVIGTTFGGDGRTTFNLPDLRGRIPVHVESGGIQWGQRQN